MADVSVEKPLLQKILDSLSNVGVGVKIRFVLLGIGVLPPIVMLLVLHQAGSDALQNTLALYIALCLALFYPFCKTLEELIVLRQTRRINAYVEEVKAGRRTPHFDLPKERGDEHDFLRLQRNIFWMIQGLQNREAKLQTARQKAEAMNKELSEAYVKLREVDQLKTDFLSMVSHELRTPLTSVLGFAEITRLDLREMVFPHLRAAETKVLRAIRNVDDNIGIILSESERLTQLINDVLDIAKMEAGKVDWKSNSLDVRDIIARAMASTAPLFQQKGLDPITRLADDLPRIVGDNDRLIQVMVNLISNAVKFTEQGSVTCSAVRHNSGIKISVMDTGPGIDAKEQAAVFEKFKQVGDTLTDKPSGTGLGLPICKQIIEHHQGEIGLNSEPGQGSEFWFVLPGEARIKDSGNQALSRFIEVNRDAGFQLLAKRLGINGGKPATKAEAEAMAPDKLVFTSPGVLLVCGQEPLTEFIGAQCRFMGLSPLAVNSTNDALATAKENQLAAVLLDLETPELRGLEIAAALRKQRSTQHTTIMGICSGGPWEESLALTLDRILVRPVNREALLQEIGFLAMDSIRGGHRDPANSKRILVALDDSHLVETLAALFTQQGFDTQRAQRADECLDKAAQFQPAIVVTGARFASRYEIMRTLRFELGQASVRAVLLA